jgi:hypothetical protein
LKFENIDLVRVSVFPVEACPNGIASFKFHLIEHGLLQLVPAFNFGGDRPELRKLALDAMDALLGLLVPSSEVRIFSGESKNIKSQLDLRVKIVDMGRTVTVPVQIWLGSRAPILSARKVFNKNGKFEDAAKIGFQLSSAGHTDFGSNDMGRRVRECFREVDRVKVHRRNWNAGVNAALPKIIRIQAAPHRHARPVPIRTRYQSRIVISSIGGADHAVLELALRHIRDVQGEDVLDEINKLFAHTFLQPTGMGYRLDLKHLPPVIRSDDGTVRSLDTLGTYELTTLKVVSVLYAYVQENSIIVLDGLDRVLDAPQIRMIESALSGLTKIYDIKVIVNDRGHDWSYRQAFRLDPRCAASQKLRMPTTAEIHPRNKIDRLTIYVEGSVDKYLYTEMLGSELADKVTFINPHEDDDYCKYVNSREGRPIPGGPLELAESDGALSVIDAVNYRLHVHAELGSGAYIGICDGDIACEYGGMHDLLEANSKPFGSQHKSIRDNIIFIPFHNIESAMLTEGKALDYLSLTDVRHRYSDLTSGPQLTMEGNWNLDFSARHSGANGEKRVRIIGDSDLEGNFKAALDKFRRAHEISIKRDRKIRPKFVRPDIARTLERIDFSDSAIYSRYALNLDASAEQRYRTMFFQMRLCDGKKLLNIAKSRITPPSNWERGIGPIMAKSKFAGILREHIRVHVKKIKHRNLP